MRSVATPVPTSAEGVTWGRTVGIFNDYTPAKRASDLLVERGLPPESVSIVVDGSLIPLDRRKESNRAFAALLGFVIGAVVGAGLAGAAAGVSLGGLDISWPLAASFGLVVGAVIGAPLGHLLRASIDRQRRVAGANMIRNGAFRLVVATEEFDRAAQAVLAPRARRRRREAVRQGSPFGVTR